MVRNMGGALQTYPKDDQASPNSPKRINFGKVINRDHLSQLRFQTFGHKEHSQPACAVLIVVWSILDLVASFPATATAQV